MKKKKCQKNLLRPRPTLLCLEPPMQRGRRAASQAWRHSARALRSVAKQPELNSATQRALEGIVGTNSVTISQSIREQHCRDESYHADTDGLFPPQAVVFPKSTEEVQEIVRLCARDQIPIVASGACTSLEGHLAALQGGISLNMREMNQVLEVPVVGIPHKHLHAYILLYDIK